MLLADKMKIITLQPFAAAVSSEMSVGLLCKYDKMNHKTIWLSEHSQANTGRIKMNLYDFAIKMEQDGEKYYLEQAASHKGHAISRVFTLLAGAEQKHARLLQKRAEGLNVTAELSLLTDDRNVFNELEDFKADVTSIPRQLDIYAHALDLEEKSVAQYEELLDKMAASEDQELLRFLIDQEKQHYELFDTLLTLLRRPEDWVEDAEFGKREDY